MIYSLSGFKASTKPLPRKKGRMPPTNNKAAIFRRGRVYKRYESELPLAPTGNVNTISNDITVKISVQHTDKN